MLRQRIITALIVAPVALAGVFLLPPVYFAVFVGAVLTVSAWEWGNLAGLSSPMRYAYGAIIAVSMAAIYWLPTMPVLVMSLIWWAVAFVLVVGYPKFDELWGNKAVILVIGFVVLLPGFQRFMRSSSFHKVTF